MAHGADGEFGLAGDEGGLDEKLHAGDEQL
jgi:hypothetical protein